MLKYPGICSVYSARSWFGGSVNVTIVAWLGPARALKHRDVNKIDSIPHSKDGRTDRQHHVIHVVNKYVVLSLYGL